MILPPGETVLGSGAGCDARIPVPGVSRRHALVVLESPRSTPHVADLGSKNGTSIDGDRIDGEGHELAPGQCLALGPVRLRLETVEPEDVDLGLDLGAWGDPAHEERDESVPSERTVSLEGRDPTLRIVVEVLDRLWRLENGSGAALVGFAADVFAATGAALLELRPGEAPAVLGVAGDFEGLDLDPARSDDSESLGFRFGRAEDPSRPDARSALRRGRLRLSSDRALDLVLRGAEPDPRVAAPLVHLFLLWAIRDRPDGARTRLEVPSDVLPFPKGHLPGRSASMRRLYTEVSRIAASDLPVLLLGETGVGKEEVAKLLHAASPRCDGPLVAVNCAAIPAELLEAELFGITAGVATGVRARRGRIAAASGGTLLLDEIGDLEPTLQAKLLRVLQEGTVEPLGGPETAVDVRVVSATHAELTERVESGTFRRDLYYRIAGAVVRIPPLRERREDLPRLIEHFARRAVEKEKRAIRGFTVRALGALCEHSWPGNVRELEHAIRRLVLLCPPGAAVDSSMLWQSDDDPSGVGRSGLVGRLETLERRLIVEALEATGGNQTRAAERLEISRNGLLQRMRRLDVPTRTGRGEVLRPG